MPRLDKDSFFTRIRERVGDDTSDDAVRFIEDMTDTYTELEKEAHGDGTDWKKKYEENDAAWAKRYRDRFFHGDPGTYTKNQELPITVPDEIPAEEITIEDLFRED